MDKRVLAGIIVIIIIVGGVGGYFLLKPAPPKGITILYNSGNTYRERIATLIATEWGKLGVYATTRGVPWATYLDLIEGKDWDMYIIGWAPDFMDPDDYVYPLMYGGTVFSYLNYVITNNASVVGSLLSNAKVFPTENNWYVVVGEKGTGATVSVPSGAHLVIVPYTVDTKNTVARNASMPWVNICPSYFRNETADALILVGEEITDPAARTAVYQAVEQISNFELPAAFLGQNIYAHDQWTWLKGFYFHPVLAPRYDLLWEENDTPSKEIGSFGGGVTHSPSATYVNNKSVLSIITFGFPQTFDPAKDYETFGWEIFHEIGDTLVTYWKTETESVTKDLSIAWAHNAEGTQWYFVIRNGTTAYNPFKNVLNTTTDETYTINATDVLFNIWRIARLSMDPSWMIRSYVDVNHSEVLTESEFNQVLENNNLTAEWNGHTETPKNLTDLLNFFGDSGTGTAGVVMLNLTMPYAAILSVLTDPFTMVVPMKYIFDAMGKGNEYAQALKDSDYGKNPSAWAKYIIPGSDPNQEPSHKVLHRYVIGTGPFYIYDYGPAQDFIILKKNPYYWNKSEWSLVPNGGHNIVLYIMNDDAKARENLYISGAGDLGAIPVDRMEALNNTKFDDTNYKFVGFKDVNTLTIDIVYAVWNTLKYPFNETKIRQALAWAIPYDKIINDIYFGYAIKLYGFIPKTMLGYTLYRITQYSYNPTKAKQLLINAGLVKPLDALKGILPDFLIGLPTLFLILRRFS